MPQSSRSSAPRAPRRWRTCFSRQWTQFQGLPLQMAEPWSWWSCSLTVWSAFGKGGAGENDKFKWQQAHRRRRRRRCPPPCGGLEMSSLCRVDAVPPPVISCHKRPDRKAELGLLQEARTFFHRVVRVKMAARCKKIPELDRRWIGRRCGRQAAAALQLV